MAPPRALSTPRALKVKMAKSKKRVGHEIGVSLTDLHQILHARSCNHFLWLPHAPKPIKRPERFNLLFAFIQILLFGLTF